MSVESYKGKTFVIEDPDARLREPDLATFSTWKPGDTIPPGKKVGDFVTLPIGARIAVAEVKVARGLAFVRAVATDDPTRGLGWTSTRNLKGKFFNETIGASDPPAANKRGPHAAWENGVFIGQETLTRIVGWESGIEALTMKVLVPFLGLVAAAAKDGVTLVINSGFRSWPEQDALHKRFLSNPKIFALAAKPGFSNHQNGIALDIIVHGFGTVEYLWMTKHAPGHGFLRTVSGEPWHWEFRPAEAAALAAKGEFKRAGVSP